MSDNQVDDNIKNDSKAQEPPVQESSVDSQALVEINTPTQDTVVAPKPKYNKAKVISTIFNVAVITAAVGFLLVCVFSSFLFGPDNPISVSVKQVFDFFTNLDNYIPTLITIALYILVVLGVSKLIRLIIRAAMPKVKKRRSIALLLDSFVKYAAGIVLALLVLSAVGVDTTTLLAGAGVLTLVIGMGSKSLIEDVISGLFIVFEKTFELGDIVVVDGFRGVVQEIGLRTTKIVDAGGDTKIINNSDIRSAINMTNDLSLALCYLNVEYGDSIERVENIIKKNLTAVKERIPSIAEGPFYKGVSKLGDNSVEILVIAKCKEEDKFQTLRDLNREFKIIFDKNNINIPFPQLVVHQPSNFRAATERQRATANAFVDEQKELSKHLKEE